MKSPVRFVLLLAACFSLGFVSPLYGVVKPEQAPICFSELKESGLLVKTLDSVTPSQGCLQQYDLVFPEFERGVLNRGPIANWVAGYETFPSSFSSFDS